MSRRTTELTDALHAYLVEQTVFETDVMRQLRAETDKLPDAKMQISPEQGQFMKFLAGLIGARRALEIGTFTGYSACWIADGLPADGRLICCDINEEWGAIARKYWRQAGLAEKIELRLAPALDTMDALLNEISASSAAEDAAFDFIFIDADKENSRAYYERSLALLRPGGVLAIDNAFQGGNVADPAVADADAPLRLLNREICQDPRVNACLASVGDGLMLAMKKTVKS